MAAERAPIILWQTGPCWGTPSTSPFCIKLETWLRMTAIPYEVRVLARPARSRTGKVPYIERPDGSLLADTGAIIDALGREHGVTLDDDLDPRATATATAIMRMLEDHFYWAIAWDRWVPAAHYSETRIAYFSELPWPLSTIAPPLIRRRLTAALHGQGFGRLRDDAIVARAERDLEALAVLVGSHDSVLGRPSSLDATAYGFLLAAKAPPWDGPLQRALRRHPNLVHLCDAIERRYWS